MISNGKMLCLTIYSYKKEGLGDEEYREYMLKTHAPLASTLMEKYGIVDFTMVVSSSSSVPSQSPDAEPRPT